MKFSVTIPAYKSSFLDEAIKSVVGQTCAEWELIVVDDCSPENLEAIVMPYLSDKRIHYYRNEKNCGAVDVVDNWNICLSYCTGDYVICMGDDDRLLPNCLEEYAQLIKKYPFLNVYHTRSEIINEEGELTNLQEPRPEWESVFSFLWNRWDHRNKQYIGDFCYSTAYLKRVGGYYKLPLAWGADDITATRAAEEKGIANTMEFGFQYRENSKTITSSNKNAKTKLLASLAWDKWYRDFLSRPVKRIPSADDWRYVQTIETPRRAYLLRELGKDCSDYIRGNPLAFIRCCRMLRGMAIPKTLLVRWYVASVCHLFF